MVLLFGLAGDTATRADGFHTHMVCPEHGEQLHAVAPDRPRGTGEITSAPDGDHQAGCVLALLGNAPNDRWLPTPPSAPSAPDWADAPPPAPSDATLVHARARLEFAPKTSPPRA